MNLRYSIYKSIILFFHQLSELQTDIPVPFTFLLSIISKTPTSTDTPYLNVHYFFSMFQKTEIIELSIPKITSIIFNPFPLLSMIVVFSNMLLSFSFFP